jgi:hypothetical protein
MVEQKARSERILVFDDDDITFAVFQEVGRQVALFVEQQNNRWNGGFGWHEDWRASGHGRICESKEKKVEAQGRFEAAYKFCKEDTFRGICFFDFTLKGVSVTSMHNWESIRSELGSKLEEIAIKYPGLLLAIATAKNPRADVDVWLATSSPETLEALIDPLMNLTGKTFGVCSRGSLTTQSAEQLNTLLTTAIDKYVKTRSPDEIENILWPYDSSDWFDSEKVPHNRPAAVTHSAFATLIEYATRIATAGNRIAGVKNEALSNQQIRELEDWVRSSAGYEVLKSFVGRYSPCFGGGHQLKLSAFAVALLAAVGPGHWVKGVPWEELSPCETAILGKRKNDCRKAVLAAFRFFEKLKLNKYTRERNDVTVRFFGQRDASTKRSMTYLDVSFGFSPLDKDGRFLARLSGGSAEPEDMSGYGDSSQAFRDLKQALRNPDAPPNTHIWVFPEVDDSGVRRTVIRFGVYHK